MMMMTVSLMGITQVSLVLSAILCSTVWREFYWSTMSRSFTNRPSVSGVQRAGRGRDEGEVQQHGDSPSRPTVADRTQRSHAVCHLICYDNLLWLVCKESDWGIAWVDLVLVCYFGNRIALLTVRRHGPIVQIVAIYRARWAKLPSMHRRRTRLTG